MVVVEESASGPGPSRVPGMPDFSGLKLTIATPCYGGMCSAKYTQCLLGLQHIAAHLGVPLQVSFIMNESLVQRARNRHVKDFLKTDFTHLLFIDSDIEFDPMDVFRLLHICKDEKRVIGGTYSKKGIDWKRIAQAVKAGVTDPNDLAAAGTLACINFNNSTAGKAVAIAEPVEVLDLPTGFMMIHRSVFDEMKEKMPEITYIDDVQAEREEMYAFFDCIIRDNRYLSEDYTFVRRWQDMGHKVWLCPWIRTSHYGTHAFVFDVQRLAKNGLSV